MLFVMSCDNELRRGIYTDTDLAATVDRMLCYLPLTASEDAFQHSKTSWVRSSAIAYCIPEAP